MPCLVTALTSPSDKQTGLRGLPLALAACLPILFLLILEKSDAADGGGPRASPREGAWNHTEGPCAIAVEGIDCVPGAPTEQERLRKKTRVNKARGARGAGAGEPCCQGPFCPLACS